ncbi:hypothetical protein OROMI_003155 [Orobanche minor]
MSAAHDGNESGSNGATPKGNKNGVGRRSWTADEETTLIAALKELIAQGWKSDNGYKAGYLNKLEEAMNKVFPTTDLKGVPHINSRLCSWKKSYYSLCGILGRSGVGFNTNGRHMIEIEDDQWDQAVKADNNARLVRYKSWPYYDNWLVIFGKDRANGEAAEDVLEAWRDIIQTLESETFPMGPNGVNEMNIDTQSAHEGTHDSVSHTHNLDQPEKPKGNKRKAGGEMQGVCDVLREIGDKTHARLRDLTKRIGYDFDVSIKRKEAFELLSAIEGLSLEERFDVCDLLAKEIEKLDVFMGLPQDAREAYMMRILSSLRN